MKKLLVLFLVFAMASWASAGLITYSLSDSEIELGSSDVITVTVIASDFDADGLTDISMIATLVTTITGDTGSFVISNLAADAAWTYIAGTTVTIADTDYRLPRGPRRIHHRPVLRHYLRLTCRYPAQNC